MKKLMNKVRRRKSTVEESSRITTETIAEHRERILAGGRRFKYPVQYARHRLVFNAIILGIVAVILAVVAFWWQLYLVQNTSDFMYRVTKVIPLSVARVDGQSVRYSDYLMKYRSSIHYLEEKEQVNLNTEDGRRQSDFVKQQAMQDAIADALAIKIAKEKNITVSDVELETYLKAQRNSSDGAVSEGTYDAVILDYYGWSPDEYRHAMENKLLRQKVMYAVDENADKMTKTVATALEGSADLKAIAESINASGAQVVYGVQGWVPRNNQDGGLAIAAAKLGIGGVSPVVRSSAGDGYYFVKLLEANDTQVNYEFIHIPLSAFVERVEKVRTDNKVVEYISIPTVTTTE